jgi:hypothetical protein
MDARLAENPVAKSFPSPAGVSRCRVLGVKRKGAKQFERLSLSSSKTVMKRPPLRATAGCGGPQRMG